MCALSKRGIWWILRFIHFDGFGRPILRQPPLLPCFPQGIERFCESMSARQQEILSRLEEFRGVFGAYVEET